MNYRPTVLSLLVAGFAALCPFLSLAQSTTVPWAWAERGASSFSSHGRSVAVDGTGAVYATGFFNRNLTAGTTTLTTDSTDAYIIKYSPQGSVVWARQLGCSGQASGLQIVVDASGNSYVSGLFRGTIPLGSSTLTNQGGMDEYIVKYTAQGTPEWSLRTTDNFRQAGYGHTLVPFNIMHLALDAQGNLYTATQFWGTVTRGTSTFTSQGTAYTTDALLTKYSSQGQVLWARQGGGNTGDAAIDVAVDNAGNAYVLGKFGGQGPATFGNVTFQPDVSLNNDQNLYVLKYDAQGNTQWGVPVLPPSSRDYAFATAIDVDAGGNAYILGYFADQISLGATTLRLLEPGSSHIFLAKLSSQGQFQWARMAGSVPPNSNHVSNGNDLAVQPDGTVSITGIYSYSMSFENIALGTDKAINQIFVARYDTQGNLSWAGRAGGGSRAVPSFSGNNNIGFGVATGPEGVTYMTGQYGGQGTFGPFALDSTANGRPNMYVAKIGAGVTLGTPRESSQALAVFPNPAAMGTVVSVRLAQQTPAATELRLINAVGQVVQRQILEAGSSQCVIATQKLSPGLYHVQLLGSKGFSRALLVQ